MTPRLRTTLERAGLVALGVALDTASMPPGPAPALVFVADAPFLWLLWHRGGEHWKRWAFLYGFLRFVVGLRWLVEVHWAEPLGAAAILALTYVAWGASIRYLAKRGVPFPLAVGAMAVLQEISQTVVVVASGMPWPHRALAFTAWPTLLGAACELGGYGLSFLAAATSAWVSGLPAAVRASPYRHEHVRRLVGAAVPLLLLLGVAAGRGALRISSVDARLASREAFRTQDLVLVQANVAQALKHETRQAEKIFGDHVALTQEALDWFKDHQQVPLAVLWPETMVPYPFMEPALATRSPELWDDWKSEWNVMGHLRYEASRSGIRTKFLIGVGYYFHGRTGHHDALLDYDTKDSLFYVDPWAFVDEPATPDPNDPSWLPAWQVPGGRHDKAILVPFGEYTPGGDTLPFLRRARDLLGVRIPEITPGDSVQVPFLLAEVPPAAPGRPNRAVLAGTVICFELAFPARCRAWRRAGATVLLNAANYGWFGDTDMPAQVTALARLRAVELAVTVAIAGNSGPTSIIDPAGRTVCEVEVGGKTQFVTGWCHGPLVCDPGYVTTYALLGDYPWYILAVLLFGWARFGPRGRRPMGDSAANSSESGGPEAAVPAASSPPANSTDSRGAS